MEENVLDWLKKYHRVTNYMSTAMLYLRDNFLLEEELKPEHIKLRLLGHWGTVPGLNLIYGGLNYLANKTDENILVVAGPGHGAPAILSNLFLEGTISKYYDEITFNSTGLKKIIKYFSWPGGFPSHTYPGIPGTIHEGGELGYSLGTAYGAALDNPDTLVVCVVGDGEAETGPLAAAWNSNKFINPKTSGVVLPILHLNGYRISGPTIFGTMDNASVVKYFRGLGYIPIVVDQYKSEDFYKDFLLALNEAHRIINDVKTFWSEGSRELPYFPIIIFRSKKGWSMPEKMGDMYLEDHNNSHGIPLKDPINNEEEFKTLKTWLESYKINELLSNHFPKKEIFEYLPSDNKKLGRNRNAYGGEVRADLKLPDIKDHAVVIKNRGSTNESLMIELSEYLAEVFKLNEDEKNFRIFSPDESESNMLEPIYKETVRDYIWPVRERDSNYSKHGRIMEILSEHVLQEWMQGYNLTGRHGMLISYEAFLGIITSQIDQYIKYLKQSLDFEFRKPLPSMNYVATSTTWRQDHNGFTHQNPGLISTLLSKQVDFINIYFPSDVNTLLATTDECLKSTNAVNLIISDKRDLPQWLDIDEAKQHVKNGISVWDWASNMNKNGSKHDRVDIVLASAGDHQTVETLAAAQLLKEMVPELKFQYVNINEISRLGLGDGKKAVMDDNDFEKYFTRQKQVIFNFHGYPEAIKQLTWSHEISQRMLILGFIEKGTTTTPFDMQVLNGTSRYHVCIHAIMAASEVNEAVARKKDELINELNKILLKHKSYIMEFGDDMPEVKDFKFDF